MTKVLIYGLNKIEVYSFQDCDVVESIENQLELWTHKKKRTIRTNGINKNKS